jgi:predicted site-specific integrase-resolvase
MSLASSTWLKAKTAADRLGVTVYKLHNMALAGQIRTMIEPGATPRYSAEDVDRLAIEAKPQSAGGIASWPRSESR